MQPPKTPTTRPARPRPDRTRPSKAAAGSADKPNRAARRAAEAATKPADPRSRTRTDPKKPPQKRPETAPRAPRARPDSAPRIARERPRNAPKNPVISASPTHENVEPQRIARLLARAGVASRRDIEHMITEGRIAVNGETITTPATIVKSLSGITVNGLTVSAMEPTRVFRFHKPAGVLTTSRDPGGRPTIFDILPPGLPRTVPVGRLDMNTEGLLLLTTDGALKRSLELPSSGVPRSYRVRAYGEIHQKVLENLIDGITIEGTHFGPIDAGIERRTGRNLWIYMTLTEGKNREIRRVLEHLGLQVSRLIRISYGPIDLGDLPPRGVDEVPPQFVAQMLKLLKPV